MTSKSAIALVASSCEPAGSSIVTSIAPPWLRGDHERNLGALTSSAPFANSTRVCSAARTSSWLARSDGRTSTTVVATSPAVMRTSPVTTSTVAEIGSRVSKVGIQRTHPV